jgi:DNA adenine methylase
MQQKNTTGKYPGSKTTSGMFQMIANNTPAHSEYFELFGGSAVIGKTFSAISPEILHSIFDLASSTVEKYFVHGPNIEYRRADGLKVLRELIAEDRRDIFVYCDPPYVFSARRNGRSYYEVEWSDEDHIAFLNLAAEAHFPIMISGYESELYSRYLAGWEKTSILARTHVSTATEVIWMNYDISKLRLQTYKYLGSDFTDRQRIQRRVTQMVRKFEKIPIHERQLLVESLINTI